MLKCVAPDFALQTFDPARPCQEFESNSVRQQISYYRTSRGRRAPKSGKFADVFVRENVADSFSWAFP